MIQTLTLPGAFHTVLAAAGIVIGLIQLLRLKGDSIHRALGYAYVYAMFIANGTAMLIYRFTGTFNIFHVGALVNLVCIIFAIDSDVAQAASAELEDSALLLHVLVVYGLAGGGGDRTRRADPYSGHHGTGLDANRCDVDRCNRRRLCPDQSIPAGFGIAPAATTRRPQNDVQS